MNSCNRVGIIYKLKISVFFLNSTISLSQNNAFDKIKPEIVIETKCTKSVKR